MTLRVWSRITCRWVRWRGTLTAWKLLPHAVVTATCTVAVGSVAWRAIQVDRPTLPVIAPVDKPMPYSAQPQVEGSIGYLNPWRSFEVDATPPWPGGIYVVPKCEAKQDHDRDDCKRRSVPEPATWAMLAAGLGMMAWRVKCG